MQFVTNPKSPSFPSSGLGTDGGFVIWLLRPMHTLTATLAILWASPWTLFGLANGLLALATGGRVRRHGRVLEFSGGWATFFLKTFPLVAGAAAVTFGHTVLGRNPEALNAARSHELVHVRQYEHWGPLFVPAYLACWVVLRLRGKNPYFDNPFEREAFDEARR